MEQHNVNARADGIYRNDDIPLSKNVTDLTNTQVETEQIDRVILAKNVVCIEHSYTFLKVDNNNLVSYRRVNVACLCFVKKS